MAKILVLVCLVLVAMDVVAGILSIKAEFAKNKVTRMKLRTIECKESNRDAYKLGLAAAVLLALAHVTSNLLSGCICTSFMEELERSSSTKRKICSESKPIDEASLETRVRA
ncbi:protein VASCULATURE COMPLEXITY AND CONNECTIVITY-like [Fagus crenata]